MNKNKLIDIMSTKFGKLIDKISDANIKKEENTMEVKKEADAHGLDPKQKEVDVKTTGDLLNGEKAEPAEKNHDEKLVKSIDTTKDLAEHSSYKLAEQDETRKVLDKLSAFEYMNLMEFIQKKSGDIKNIQRHTEKDYEAGVKAQTANVTPGLEKVVEKGHAAIENGTLKVAGSDVKDIERFTTKDYEKGEEARKNPVPGLEKAVEAGHDKIEKGTLKVAEETKDLKVEAASAEAVAATTEVKDSVTKLTEVKDDLALLQTQIMEKVTAALENNLTAKLFKHNVNKTIAKITAELKLDEEKSKAVFEAITKGAAGKDYYYYFTGAKAPKSVDMTTGDPGIYTSEHAGTDVTKVEKDKQTTYENQQPKTDKKDEYTSATEKVRKEKESQNTIEQTKKKMKFATLFNKEGATVSKISNWTVLDEEGDILVKATLEDIWKDEVDKNLATFEDEKFVDSYAKELTARLETDGVEKVAELLGTTAKSKKSKEDEIMKMVEEIENAVGIQEPAAHDEKEKKLKFIDHVLEEMKELHKHFVKKAPETKMPEEKKKDKDFSGTVEDQEKIDSSEKPLEEQKKQLEESTKTDMPLATEASILDKQEIMLGDGYMAIKDKETKTVEVKDKDGKSLAKWVDGFGDDAATVIQLMRQVLKLDKKKEKPEEAKKPEDTKKPEDKKMPEEKKDDKKYSSLETDKSQKELELEAEVVRLRTEASIKEKQMKCRALIEEMLDRKMIQPDEETVKISLANNEDLIDAKKAGLIKAVDDQMTEFFKMDKSAFEAFSKSVKKIQKSASKKDVLTEALNIVTDPVNMGQTDDEWFKSLPWS